VAIIKRSIDEVRKRARELQEIRCSPSRYNKVPSKVMQHINSYTQLTASNLRQMNESHMSPSNSRLMASSSSSHFTRIPEKRDRPFDITQDEMNRIKGIQLN
jgi:hypothetical protein